MLPLLVLGSLVLAAPAAAQERTPRVQPASVRLESIATGYQRGGSLGFALRDTALDEALYRRSIEAFGSAEAVLGATQITLRRVKGIGEVLARQIVAAIQRPKRLGQERHVAGVAMQQQGMPLRLLVGYKPAMQLGAVLGGEIRVLHKHSRLAPLARRVLGRLKDAAALQPRGRRVSSECGAAGGKDSACGKRNQRSQLAQKAIHRRGSRGYGDKPRKGSQTGAQRQR